MAQKKRRSSAYEKARLARLAAVQAFYQILQRDQALNVVMDAFVLNYLSFEETEGKPDVDLFRHLVKDAFERQTDIKPIIESALNQDWRYERLDIVLKAVLYIATAEMLSRPTSAPAPVVIMEYTAITRSFYEGKEIAFINGYLDRLARQLNYPLTKEEKTESL